MMMLDLFFHSHIDKSDQHQTCLKKPSNNRD